MLRLSALDQSPVRSTDTPADAIGETLDLARAADRLGYHRYWLAEHHSTPALAGPSPEVLIPQVAAVTSGIRVGSGGVMLQHYSALKVAESFRVLETLYPGRIDLGIGRAPGSDQITARALAGPGAVGVEDFVGKVSDLLGFLNNGLPLEHPYGHVLAMPTGPTSPEVWLLGSSDQSAILAAHFGLGFSFAHFINADGGAEVTRAYARAFKPSAAMPEPQASVAVFVVCAPTEEEATRLAQSRDLFITRLYTGRLSRYPTVAEAEAYEYTPREWMIVEHARRRRVVGTPAQCRERLEALAAEYGVEEVVVVTITETWETRVRSYELLAGAFGLTPRA
ncbi:MAG TPA: LLM class flavin-dependent oxidoreductase [Methylomirabilota bacterium]|jgi:luciferase family oxidoreductase group 1|nr:LLM class flavin-dependent oxidoreductase [Methylomirabilota bacterium]